MTENENCTPETPDAACRCAWTDNPGIHTARDKVLWNQGRLAGHESAVLSVARPGIVRRFVRRVVG